MLIAKWGVCCHDSWMKWGKFKIQPGTCLGVVAMLMCGNCASFHYFAMRQVC